jgi:hypothetical protein
MQKMMPKADGELENQVLREWLKLAPGLKIGIAIRDFELDLWSRGLRLGASPFLHHQGVMRVIENSPLSADLPHEAAGNAQADEGLLELVAANATIWLQRWRRYFFPKWTVVRDRLGHRHQRLQPMKYSRRNRSF